jgi:hypothetical protein
MQTDLPPEEDPQAQRLHRMVSSIEALNARIARLAMGLGVSIKSDDDLARLMSRHHVPAVTHEHQLNQNLHMENQWEELRGLLVLRYGIETSYVDQVGVIATRQIFVEAEQHLLLDGFNLGDDGVDQNVLFDKP